MQLAQQQSMSLDRLMLVALVEKLSTVFPNEAMEERAGAAHAKGSKNSSATSRMWNRNRTTAYPKAPRRELNRCRCLAAGNADSSTPPRISFNPS